MNLKKVWHGVFGCKPDYVWKEVNVETPQLEYYRGSYSSEDQNIYCSVCDRWFVTKYQITHAMASYTFADIRKIIYPLGDPLGLTEDAPEKIETVLHPLLHPPFEMNLLEGLPIPIDDVIKHDEQQ